MKLSFEVKEFNQSSYTKFIILHYKMNRLEDKFRKNKIIFINSNKLKFEKSKN